MDLDNLNIKLCRRVKENDLVAEFENRMIESGMTLVFLDEDYSSNEYDVYITETISTGEFNPTARLAVLHVMLEKMYNRLKILPPRKRRLLAYHYGLGSLECKSISETAAYFHLTEKYIKIIEDQVLSTLRDGMNDGEII